MTSVSLQPEQSFERDNEADRPGASTPEPALTSPLDLSDKEALVSILPAQADDATEARPADTLPAGAIPPELAVPVLQNLLAAAIASRETAIAEVDRLRSLPYDKHWFVVGLDGYCAACSLPQKNGRHVARGVAA